MNITGTALAVTLFFWTDKFQQGTVYYNGSFYENVPLLYDELRDELISKTFSKSTDIKLLGEKITSFTIGPYTFIRLVPDSLNNLSLAAGFYEKLYEGVVTVLDKHEKKIEVSLKINEDTSRFVESDHYYIVKDGNYHSVKTEGDILSVFKDKRTEMRKFLNRKDVYFKKEKAKTIVQAAAYYSELKK